MFIHGDLFCDNGDYYVDSFFDNENRGQLACVIN